MRYADMSTSRLFEGLTTAHYSDQDKWDVGSQNEAALTNVHGPWAVKLLASREVRTLREDLVKLVMGFAVPFKLRIYSAHDSNLARWMDTLSPQFWYHDVPYSSQLLFQVFQKDSEKLIKIHYQGRNVQLDGCKGLYCTINEFIANMERFTVPVSDLKN